MDLKGFKEWFGDRRILVLAGGWSREREVSLRSGKRVLESLLRQGFRAELYDPGPDFPREILARKPDVVLIMLHGKPGEDGTFQGALEAMGIPYTGSGVLASAIGIDKATTKRLFEWAGLPTPPWVLVPEEQPPKEAAQEALEKLDPPLIVKPRAEGSSIGVTIVRDPTRLPEILRERKETFGELIIERYIPGKTVTIGVLGTGPESFPLPILELRVKHREFYDYTAKYTKGETEFVIPAEIPQNTYRALQEYAVQAHRLLGCRGFSRTDAVVSETGEPFLLEVNTIPGMTELSDLPAEAEAMGISYDEVVLYILKSAFE